MEQITLIYLENNDADYRKSRKQTDIKEKKKQITAMKPNAPTPDNTKYVGRERISVSKILIQNQKKTKKETKTNKNKQTDLQARIE